MVRITPQDFQVTLPVICLLVGAIMLLFLEIMLGRRGEARGILVYFGVAIVVISSIALLSISGARVDMQLIGAFGVGEKWEIVLDALVVFAGIIILIFAAFTMLGSINYANFRNIQTGEYYALILFSCSGALLLVMSHELITLFLALELMSVPVYILTSITRYNLRANEAALKYFVIGAFSSIIMLMGFVFLYGCCGSVYLKVIAGHLLKDFGGFEATGVALAIVGFLFKVGAVPFHIWVPDAYEGAPTSITCFMSVVVKTSAFCAFIRFVLFPISPILGDYHQFVIGAVSIVAILTMVAGNLFALVQNNIKRMLAYSAISHTGYILIGIVALVSGQPLASLSAMFFYLFAYSFMTFGAFAFLIFAGVYGVDLEDVNQFSGLAKRRPWACIFMTVFLVSLIGIPPTAGFFAKFYLFKAAIEQGLYLLVIIAIVTTIISIYYYLRPVVFMFMRPEREKTPVVIDEACGVTVIICAFMTVVIGVLCFLFLNSFCGPFANYFLRDIY
jgi:NADH-quinone oxidoreductase subunit N